jgi:hypothetical protein
MGDHHIHITVHGSTDFIKKVANEAVTKLKTGATVTAAAVTHGATQVLEGVSEAAGEAAFGGGR